MYIKEKQISELYDLKHRSDSIKEKIEYDKILENTLSPYLYKNMNLALFLDRINGLVVKFYDNFHIIKNFYNYVVDKDHYKHND